MRFPHAQPRERLSSARQSFLLITEMIFDYLIAIVSSKTAAIGMSEVTKKKVRPAVVCLIVVFSTIYCSLQNCANNSHGYIYAFARLFKLIETSQYPPPNVKENADLL